MFRQVHTSDKRLLFARLLPGAICRLCGSSGAGDILCSACIADLPRLNTACRRCAIPLPENTLCPNCQRRPPPQDLCVARYHYDFPLSELIRQMKYGGQPGLCQALGRSLLPMLRSRGERLPDGLLPMPLHWQRTVARGYNQALELARPLSAALELPLLNGLCQRVRATCPQTRLAGHARRDNVRHAFALLATPPAHVAIIDDVMTSGHTAAALANCLRAAGVKRVEVWVLARAGASG